MNSDDDRSKMDDDNTSNNVPSNDSSSSSSSAGPSKSSEKRSKLDENNPSTSRYECYSYISLFRRYLARRFALSMFPFSFADPSSRAQDGCVGLSPTNSGNFDCDSSSSDDMVEVEVIRSKRRFAKRNYRQRSESASMQTPPSTSPVPPTVAMEQNTADGPAQDVEQEPQVNIAYWLHWTAWRH